MSAKIKLSPARRYVQYLTLTPKNEVQFPFELLTLDECFPATEGDSAKLATFPWEVSTKESFTLRRFSHLAESPWHSRWKDNYEAVPTNGYGEYFNSRIHNNKLSTPITHKHFFVARCVRHPRFPIDMLRYDHCVPLTTMDADHIRQSLSQVRWQPVPIRLVYFGTSKLNLIEARWHSFGWSLDFPAIQEFSEVL